MSPFERLPKNPNGASYFETLQLMDEMLRREERKDAVLMVMMKKIELLANSEMSSQESDESSSSRIESMLEVVLEQVIRKEKSSAPPNMVEEEVVEWGMEEKILKETFESILLISGGLEEVCHVGWMLNKAEKNMKVESGENESKPVAHWRNADDIVQIVERAPVQTSTPGS
ncbi:hypothetical protein HAX54_029525 [Datura stramonium]|uniref:Uncharacterized protein n=1 Tax=Datura stramonium TaxID=4076 RepID=A0ABS8V8C5_DATST|nr:hypothetical protein [Datura stramonium]